MSKVSEEEVNLPQFPALARCLIIDASFKARTSLAVSIKACYLFEEIMEASSIADGGKKISNINYDACFIGSTISADLAREFLATFKLKTMAKDCAFICMINEQSGDPLGFPEAHGVIPLPSMKKVLFEGMARAILIANKGVGWPGVKLSEDGSIMLLENGTWKPLSDAEPEKSRDELPPGFVLSGERESIEKFCESIPKTPRDKIEKIITGLLAGRGSLPTDPFIPFFIAAIKEWQSDLKFMSLKEASQELKARLLSFSDR